MLRRIIIITAILLALPWRVEAGDFGDSLKPGQFTAPSGRVWQLVEDSQKVYNRDLLMIHDTITGEYEYVWWWERSLKWKIVEPEPDSMKYQGGDGDLTVKYIADLVWEKAYTEWIEVLVKQDSCCIKCAGCRDWYCPPILRHYRLDCREVPDTTWRPLVYTPLGMKPYIVITPFVRTITVCDTVWRGIHE